MPAQPAASTPPADRFGLAANPVPGQYPGDFFATGYNLLALFAATVNYSRNANDVELWAVNRVNTEYLAISIYRLSRFLGVVAMMSAATAVSVTYLQFPPIGYEGIVFVSSVAVVLTIGSAGLSLILAATLFIRRKPPKPLTATTLSVLSLALAFTYVWTM